MSWLDTLFPHETIGPLAYGAPSSGEPGGWHHGVDVIATGALDSPVSGRYDPNASGAYRVAVDTGAGELIFAHIKNALYGSGVASITQGMDLGSVLTVNPQTGEPFSVSETYTDPAGGWYVETAPHVHVEAHTAAGSAFGSNNVENPALFPVGGGSPAPAPGPTPTPTAPGGSGGSAGGSSSGGSGSDGGDPGGPFQGAPFGLGPALDTATASFAAGLKRYAGTLVCLLASAICFVLAARKQVLPAARDAAMMAA